MTRTPRQLAAENARRAAAGEPPLTATGREALAAILRGRNLTPFGRAAADADLLIRSIEAAGWRLVPALTSRQSAEWDCDGQPDHHDRLVISPAILRIIASINETRVTAKQAEALGRLDAVLLLANREKRP